MRTILLFFLFLTCCRFVHAQETKLRPSFGAIIVSNIDSSAAWYRKVFGMEIRNRMENKERGARQVILINTQLMIELIELTTAVNTDSLLSTHPKGTRSRGFTKFGFSTADIDAWWQKLGTLGVKFYGKMVTDPVTNKRTFLVQDPDGNLIQFFEE